MFLRIGGFFFTFPFCVAAAAAAPFWGPAAAAAAVCSFFIDDDDENSWQWVFWGWCSFLLIGSRAVSPRLHQAHAVVSTPLPQKKQQRTPVFFFFLIPCSFLFRHTHTRGTSCPTPLHRCLPACCHHSTTTCHPHNTCNSNFLFKYTYFFFTFVDSIFV